MKKKLLLVAIMCCLLAGCGGKPSDVSEEVYDMAVYAIDVVDLYLDGETTIEETDEKLEQFDIDLDYDDVEYEGDNSVKGKILHVQAEVSSLALSSWSKEIGGSGGSGSLSEVKEARNELAKQINYKD